MEIKKTEASLQNHGCTDIIPYAPLRLVSADFSTTVQDLEERITESPMHVYTASQTTVIVGVEGTNELVLNPAPITAIPQGVVENQPQNIQQREKQTFTTKINFERITISSDPVKYKLKSREVVTPSATENIGQIDDNHFITHDILNDWKLECRMRADENTIDKFYKHSSSKRIFRSLVEVKSFVDRALSPPQDTTIRLEGPSQQHASPSADRKRKRVREEKYNSVDDFMAKTYANLLNSSNPISNIEPLQKEFVEKFLGEASERFMGVNKHNIEIKPSLGNSGTESQEEITEMVVELYVPSEFIELNI